VSQAIKVLAIGDPNSEVNKDIRKEIDILRKCKSPHIVSYFGTALQKAPDDTHDLWVTTPHTPHTPHTTHTQPNSPFDTTHDTRHTHAQIMMDYCGKGSVRFARVCATCACA
jgi:hypothetical protein